MSMGNLAAGYQTAGKLNLALPLFEETLKLTKAKLGADHPQTLVSMGSLAGGVAGEIIARINELAFEWLDAPIRRLTAPDVPIPFSPPLEQAVLPQLDDMKEACRELIAY